MTPLTELLIALCEAPVNNKYEMSTQRPCEIPVQNRLDHQDVRDSGHLLGLFVPSLRRPSIPGQLNLTLKLLFLFRPVFKLAFPCFHSF
jgi:hypothetical protein